MKATLEFTLPEESPEFQAASKGLALQGAAESFSEWLRRRFKHTCPANDEVEEFYEEVKREFYEEFEGLLS